MRENNNVEIDENDNDSCADTISEVELLTFIAGTNTGSSVDPTNFRHTDVGNAELFITLFRENLRYVEEWHSWLLWNDRRWIELSDTALFPLATRVTEHMFIWANMLPKEAQTKLVKHAMLSQRKERLKAMIDIAKGNESVRVNPGHFDAKPWLLGCGAVTYDLRANNSYLPKREDYVTKSTAIAPDMNATCPNWEALLNWAFEGDNETIEHIQRCVGYMLTGLVSEEKIFFLFGDGSNGKTTIAMTIYEMLGDYAGKARSDLLVQTQGEKGAASPDVAALHGKRLVVVSETDDHASLSEAQIKMITSNEPITARRLHRDPFTFMPTHKTLLMSNYRPFVKGTDDGIWRRLNIFGFNAKIEEADKNPHYRDQKLRPELPAILAWAIRGCAMWMHDGLKTSLAVKREAEAYRSEMDYIGDWIAERTIADPKELTSRSNAYNDYKSWAEGIGAPVLHNRRLVEELRSRGYSLTVMRGERMYRGFKIRRFCLNSWGANAAE